MSKVVFVPATPETYGKPSGAGKSLIPFNKDTLGTPYDVGHYEWNRRFVGGNPVPGEHS